jgi:hypothetical protein
MKFVITSEGVKRELGSPFEMIGSPKDFARLRDQITDYLKRWEDEGISYGALTFYDSPRVPPGVNQAPRGWTE